MKKFAVTYTYIMYNSEPVKTGVSKQRSYGHYVRHLIAEHASALYSWNNF